MIRVRHTVKYYCIISVILGAGVPLFCFLKRELTLYLFNYSFQVNKEAVAKEAVAKETVAKETVAKETVAKETVAKETGAKENGANKDIAINTKYTTS